MIVLLLDSYLSFPYDSVIAGPSRQRRSLRRYPLQVWWSRSGFESPHGPKIFLYNRIGYSAKQDVAPYSSLCKWVFPILDVAISSSRSELDSMVSFPLKQNILPCFLGTVYHCIWLFFVMIGIINEDGNVLWLKITLFQVVLIILYGYITYKMYFSLVSIVVNPEITIILLTFVVVIVMNVCITFLVVISCVISVAYPNLNCIRFFRIF